MINTTLKEHYISQLYTMARADTSNNEDKPNPFKGLRLFVITAAGSITGSVFSPSVQLSKDEETLQLVTKSIVKVYHENVDQKLSKMPNDGFFTLYDVEIQSDAKLLRLKQINIFFDQVIAITVCT